MDGELTPRQRAILQIFDKHEEISSSTMADKIAPEYKVVSFRPDLAELLKRRYISRVRQGNFITYRLSTWYRLMRELPSNMTPAYLLQGMFPIRGDSTSVFAVEERRHLEALTQEYRSNIADLPMTVFRRELERLVTDHWKDRPGKEMDSSGQLDETVGGSRQSKDIESPIEAAMLLRHKACLEHILSTRTQERSIDLQFIATMYGMVMLGQSATQRPLTPTVRYPAPHTLPVRFSPILRDLIEHMCTYLNRRPCMYERALLIMVILSYAELFEDGNKRMGRIMSNVILIRGNGCPLSYRCIDSRAYRNALIQYEQDRSLDGFKRLFLKQMEYAVRHYFRSDLALPTKA